MFKNLNNITIKMIDLTEKSSSKLNGIWHSHGVSVPSKAIISAQVRPGIFMDLH
jgi:hypothetical protein